MHVTIICNSGLPGGSDGKACACNAGDLGLIPVSGRSPGERNGNPLQYSCLENPMNRGAWQVIVHGVTKSQTWLSDFTFFHFHFSQDRGLQSRSFWTHLVHMILNRVFWILKKWIKKKKLSKVARIKNHWVDSRVLDFLKWKNRFKPQLHVLVIKWYPSLRILFSWSPLVPQWWLSLHVQSLGLKLERLSRVNRSRAQHQLSIYVKCGSSQPEVLSVPSGRYSTPFKEHCDPHPFIFPTERL